MQNINLIAAHVKGMISDEEFAAMRRGILGVGIPEKKSDKSEDAIWEILL